MLSKRVVITGMGILSPIGNTLAENWENLQAGRSGIGPLTLFDHDLTAVRIAGEVKNYDADERFGRKEARRTDRVMQFAVEATRQALEHSGLEVTDENRWEIGCIVGSGIGGINALEEAIRAVYEKGHRTVSPMAIPKSLIDSSAGKVSMEFGLNGPNFCITTACATGNNVIGEAAEIIKRGQAVAMLAGASEAALVPVTMAGFNNMKALTKRNEEPERASRPFDAERDGFVPGEGAATIVLEELEHAKARGATIYGELLGYGHTSDAYHPTAPMESGLGASKAMQFALRDAQLNAEDIDYINAHGTSTQLNDAAETRAMKLALGEEAYNIPISSTKSTTGHLLGAAGAIESVFGLFAIQHNFIPPTMNLDNPDPECDLDYTPNQGIERNVDVFMSNAFGFGGHNAVIIVGRYADNGRAQ